MRHWIAAVRNLLVVMLLTAGLAGGGAAAESLSGGPARRGGILRLAVSEDVRYLDPALTQMSYEAELTGLIFQPLIEYRNGKFVPVQARAFEISNDKRTYTFHLDPDARFSNRRPVTAEDYVFSLERILSPDKVAWMAQHFENVVGATNFTAGTSPRVLGARAPDRHTFVIELNTPDLGFAFPISWFLRAVPQEELVNNRFPGHPIGSGPYQLAERKRGARLRFIPNPHYFRPARQHLHEIRVSVGGDAALHMMMFERGELDVVEPKAEHMARIRRNPKLRQLLDAEPGHNLFFLPMNNEMPPFDNVKVRQAFNYAINRERIVKLSRGLGVIAQGVLAPPVDGYDPELRGYSYDPERARQLLREAGFPNGFGGLEFWHTTTEGKMAQIVQQDLAQVGVRISLKPVTQMARDTALCTRGAMQFGTDGWLFGPDPKMFMSIWNANNIRDQDSMNTAYYNNPRVTALIEEANACSDPARRLALYRQAERLVVEDAPAVFLNHRKEARMLQPWIHGGSMPVFWLEDLWMDLERAPRNRRKERP